MKRIDPIVLGIIILSVAVIGGVVLAASLNKAQPVAQYQANSQDRPKIEVGETDFSFETINVQDVMVKEINVKNTGDAPLVLSDIITSCDCTFAQITFADRDSKWFSMQREPAWREEIAPGQQATIKIKYQPSIMPVKGKVNRTVSVKTNDPENNTVVFRFTAFVQ